MHTFNVFGQIYDVALRRWPFILIGLIAALHILQIIQVDGYGIALLILAFSPVLLPLIARYLKAIKLGKDGFEATITADNEGKPSFQLEKLVPTANSASSSDTKPPEFPYSIEARRILATLWHYQKELFGEDSLRRWGFGVGIGSPDYTVYASGTMPLNRDGLVYTDRRGLSYLTNEGITFCKTSRDILDADGPFYTQFSPAAENG